MIKTFLKWHAYQFCNFNLFGLKDKALQVEFNKWRSVSQLKQIVFITVLTAFLYYLFTCIHQYIVLPQLIPLMTFWHLYIIPTMLLFIALLAYFKKYCFFMTASLITAPIVAAVANIYIVSQIEGYTTYQTELYLIIFWVFTVSGLRLVHAVNTALIIFVIALISAMVLFPMSTDALAMHIFWMLASLSFGFMGAYLFEDSQKRLFLNYKKLEKSAVTDNLTGLYNRRKLEEVILETLKKEDAHFGILMIDIDHFKNVNDTYGHHIGDKVLMRIADILKSNSKASDISVRWGGEEFIVVCFDADEKTIFDLAETLRKKVEQTRFEKIDRLTISVGATLNKKGDDIDSMTQRADKALYGVKNDQKNSVKVLL